MDSFKIAFWKKPVSKDDSFIDLYEAELIHASVNRTERADSIHYSIGLDKTDISQVYGQIELEKSKKNNHWKVLKSKNNLEDIFLQLISALESVGAG